MPGVTRGRKLSALKEAEIKFGVLHILQNSDEAMTIESIKANDTMLLGRLSSQKMARVLGNLVEMGLVKKAKSKSLGKMVYKSVSKMIEQGYSVDEVVTPVGYKEYSGIDWELEAEMESMPDVEVEEL